MTEGGRSTNADRASRARGICVGMQATDTKRLSSQHPWAVRTGHRANQVQFVLRTRLKEVNKTSLLGEFQCRKLSY
jgi:hypothetical protein